MKNRLMLVFLLVISSSVWILPATQVDDSHIKPSFILSADGSESSDSITSFSETTADDTLLYPDSDSNLDFYASASYMHHEHFNDTTGWTAAGYGGWDHFESNGSALYCNYTTAGVGTAEQENTEPAVTTIVGKMIVVSFKWSTNQTSGTQLAVLAESADTFTQDQLSLHDYSQDTWHQAFKTTSSATDFGTLEILGYSPSSDVFIELWMDYFVITDPTLYDNRTSGYAESFADVSDWTLSGNPDSSLSTDGDVLTFVASFAGSNDAELAEPDSCVFSSAEYYFEIRWYSNSTDVDFIGVYFYDDGSNFWYFQDWIEPTSWELAKQLISALPTVGSPTAINYININVRGDLPNAIELYVDYLRISPSTEMGWQHDGSTTAGIVEDARSGWSYSYSSNGDQLTISLTRNGGSSNYGSIYIDYDVTATEATLETDYYPFLSVTWECTQLSELVYGIWYVDGRYSSSESQYVGGQKFSSTFSQTTHYLNWDVAGSATSGSGLRIVATESNHTGSHTTTVKIDYAQAYSIANWTYTGSSLDIDDYLYVESGTLYADVDDGNIVLDHDPTLSTDTSAFNVWNLTTAETAMAFDHKVTDWQGYSDVGETRGSLTSGTLTDVRIKFTGAAQSVSAITFIEDSTAPSIEEKYTRPEAPYDDEEVTFTFAVTDTVEVYSVVINAVEYPSGFSDVDYECDESVEDTVFRYTFDTMTAGDYLFEIVASDGANTDTEYIPLYVRESEIRLEAVSFLGAGTDFIGIQFSFECNVAGTFSITEWTTVNETHATDEALTQSGTVVDGLNNVFWTKLSTTADIVYFNFTIDSGSLQKNWTSTYQVAQAETFNIVNWWTELHLGVQNYVEFYVKTTAGNATIDVYDNGTLQTSVTEVEGGINSYFWMNTDTGLHNLVINASDGSTTLTRTKTYFIPDWANTALSVRWDLYTFQNNYTLITLESNWMNCTYTVYLNGSSVATSALDPVTLNISRSINTGEYNLTIFADGGTQNWTVSNIRYVVTDEGVTYDYSQVTITGGGHSETFNYDTQNVYENPTGVYMSSDLVIAFIIGAFMVPVILYVFLDRLEVLQRLKIRSG